VRADQVLRTNDKHTLLTLSVIYNQYTCSQSSALFIISKGRAPHLLKFEYHNNYSLNVTFEYEFVNSQLTSMSVLLIVGPKCTLAASHAAP